MTWHIRPAAPDDAAVLASNNVAMALETEDLALDPDVVRRGVQTVFEQDVGAHFLVACRGEDIVGQLMITTEWSDWRAAVVWWIQSVYVAPEARGSGIYRALYERVKQDARAAGAAGVRLYVDTTNTSAQAVYERLGMQGEHYRVFEAMFDA